jgi:hypothetical protein
MARKRPSYSSVSLVVPIPTAQYRIENEAPKFGAAWRKHERWAKLLYAVEDDGDSGRRLKKIPWHTAEPRHITNDKFRRKIQAGIRRLGIGSPTASARCRVSVSALI